MIASQERPPAPNIALANGGVLDPDGVKEYLEIELPTGPHLVSFARCTMRIRGLTSGGETVLWEFKSQVSEGHAEESQWFYCEKPFVDSLRGGMAVVRYTVVAPSDATAPAGFPLESEGLVVGIGQPAQPVTPPPPEIGGLVAGLVDSDLPRLLATVPTSAASVEDAAVTLTLHVDDPAFFQGLSQVLKRPPPLRARDTVEETKRIEDDLAPLSFIFRGYPATHEAQDVAASYVIVSADGTSSASAATTFRIGASLGVEPPVIEEANGEVLAIDSFTGDAHVKTQPSARIKENMYYWVYAMSEVDGEQSFYPVALEGQVTLEESNAGMRFPISREFLTSLPAGAALTMQIAVNLSGGNDPFDTVDFPTRTYEIAVAQQASWDLEDQDPAMVAPIKVGGTLSFPLMDIYFSIARISPATNWVGLERFAYSSPGFYSGVVLYIGGPTGTATDNVVELRFKRRWNSVRFALTSVDAEVVITWHTESGNTLQQRIPGGQPTLGHEAKCQLQGITKAVIEAKDGIRLDCFEFHD